MEIGYFCQMASLSMQILMRLLDMSHDMNEYVQRLFGQNILIAVCSCRALAPTLSDAGAHVGFKYGGIVIYRE